ncbi:MAG: hypothetical protein LC642_07820 [Verrucomicrobiaceae bacterium]|nr:hypothetical protein [Verrucomicrobiaceae bacterium]
MFDQPLIIILILVAGFLRWLYEKSQASKDEPQRPSEPDRTDQTISRPAPDGEEERIRRFLEALGQPTTSPPPPKVAPKREVPRTVLPQPFPRLPPLTTVPPPLPPTIPEISRARPPQIERRVFQPAIARESVFEVQDFGVQSPEEFSTEGRRAAARSQTLIPDLTSPGSLRSAIVLREIFGPPRSLQTFDLVGGF